MMKIKLRKTSFVETRRQMWSMNLIIQDMHRHAANRKPLRGFRSLGEPVGNCACLRH